MKDGRTDGQTDRQTDRRTNRRRRLYLTRALAQLCYNNVWICFVEVFCLNGEKETEHSERYAQNTLSFTYNKHTRKSLTITCRPKRYDIISLNFTVVDKERSTAAWAYPRRDRFLRCWRVRPTALKYMLMLNRPQLQLEVVVVADALDYT